MKLAELNVGYSAYPLDGPRKAGFMDNDRRAHPWTRPWPVWPMFKNMGLRILHLAGISWTKTDDAAAAWPQNDTPFS